ncbi:methylenetetrahydrofolate reductase C-terminal domain-containing protein [candidate division KSB1 bacterium]|nr:methylenetetrahydrofolate reductase C-terminal domain-containing protein [candidate division KSB1 bacterium]
MDFITTEKKKYTQLEKRLSAVLLFIEDIIKIPLFRCQRCGECILSHTAFICSQRCPKRMRNGPCGGPGVDGSCEVYPDRKCVWIRIHRRARLLGRIALLRRVENIHDWNLEKTSAWWNVVTRRIEPPTLFIRKTKSEKQSHDAA